MNTSIGHRLKLVMTELRLQQQDVAIAMDVPASWLSRNIKDEANPGVNHITQFYKLYPSVNPHWLLTGEGAMFKDSNTEPILLGVGSSDCEKDLAMANSKIEMLERIIQDKERIIELLNK